MHIFGVKMLLAFDLFVEGVSHMQMERPVLVDPGMLVKTNAIQQQ